MINSVLGEVDFKKLGVTLMHEHITWDRNGADVEQNLNVAMELAKKGIWIEFDYLGRVNDFNWHLEALEKVIENNLLNRLLISQDAGTFYFGEKNDKASILPYDRLFKEFIPYCNDRGIKDEIFYKILVENTLDVLKIEDEDL